MTREEALNLLNENLENRNLFKHSLAVEAVMRELALHFGEDEHTWGLAGLLHDIDYDRTKDDPDRHSLEGAQLLEEKGLPQEVVYAVKVHNDRHGFPRQSLLDKALFATDPVTGLIVASALIKKEKSLAAIDVPFLINRMGEKSFARGANRETIRSCDQMGLSLDDFLGIGLRAMQKISAEMGL